jgi:hypothetical protein
MAPRTRRTRDPRCLGRRPYPVSMARAPLNAPPTPPRRFGRSSSSPEDPVPATSSHQSPPTGRAIIARSGAKPVSALSRRSPGADPQGRQPVGSWTSCRPGSMAWQPATGNPGRGPAPPVTPRHPSLPLTSDGDQQSRRCLVQDAPPPVSHASRASWLHSTISPA